MRLVYTVLIGVLVAVSPMWAAAAMTAPASGQPAYGTSNVGPLYSVQSGVKSVSPDGKTLTLSNGMTLEIPSNLSTEELAVVHPLIDAMYRMDSSGHKILESFNIVTGPLS